MPQKELLTNFDEVKVKIEWFVTIWCKKKKMIIIYIKSTFSKELKKIYIIALGAPNDKHLWEANIPTKFYWIMIIKQILS